MRAGFLALFHYLDKVWKCYGELERYEEELEKVNQDLDRIENIVEDSIPDDSYFIKICKGAIEDLKKAKKIWEEMKHQHALLISARGGNGGSANYLLSNRKNHEYEHWQIIEIHDPLEKKK